MSEYGEAHWRELIGVIIQRIGVKRFREIADAAQTYHDDSRPERACHHCGKPYRGPAVYCSLQCAIADAQ